MKSTIRRWQCCTDKNLQLVVLLTVVEINSQFLTPFITLNPLSPFARKDIHCQVYRNRFAFIPNVNPL